jgi:hypothetical protein
MTQNRLCANASVSDMLILILTWLTIGRRPS